MTDKDMEEIKELLREILRELKQANDNLNTIAAYSINR